MTYSHVERNNYAKAVIEKMCPTGDIIIMGHSRAGETAIGVTADLMDKRNVRAMFLINSSGFRWHYAAKPTPLYKLFTRVYRGVPKFRGFLEQAAYKWLTGMDLFADSPSKAVATVASLGTMEFDKLKPVYDKINSKKSLPVVVAYGGSDKTITAEICREAALYFADCKELMCADNTAETDEKTTRTAVELLKNGTKTVALCYEPDGHYITRTRKTCIASCIYTILGIDKH